MTVPETAGADHALRVEGLRKQYGATVAVDGISFSVRAGEIVGLLGPNGAGKTTTINMVLGVLQPSAGDIRIEGIDLARHRSQALAHTNFAAVYAALPGNLTVYQNLRFFSLIYDVPRGSARIEQLLDGVRPAAAARQPLRRAVLGRADAAGAGKGAAEPAAAAAAR